MVSCPTCTAPSHEPDASHPTPPLLCSHQRWEQMPVLRWSCRCAEIPERKSLKPLFESCQQCAIRCSEHQLCIWQPSTPEPRTSPSCAGLVHLSLTVDSAALSFFYTYKMWLPSTATFWLFILLYIYLFFRLVICLVLFCGTKLQWAQRLAWNVLIGVVVVRLPSALPPLLISSTVTAACEILCMKLSHTLARWIHTYLFIYFLNSQGMTSIMYQYLILYNTNTWYQYLTDIPLYCLLFRVNWRDWFSHSCIICQSIEFEVCLTRYFKEANVERHTFQTESELCIC